MINKEIDQIDQKLSQIEEEGIKNTLKHFDRIHDKLFTFNNILIAGYFALFKVYNTISIFSILIPVFNLILLIFIEYRMMERSRFEARITDKKFSEMYKHGRLTQNTNLYSLLSILTTTIVTIIFICYLVL
ncbi:MAG: hypothetical protein IPM95_14515 [Sphingobacteriales bacterium]|jgi:hypothetical protein|nr:hypothetical protein [Sphingobacteriales bacterium]